MSSIFTEIKNLRNWDYYERNEYKLEKIKDWDDEYCHEKFIENFLIYSEKDCILEHFDIKLKDLSRKKHTNSVFFLGCLFYKKLKIGNKLTFKRKDKKEQFHFIWFLSTLVHDFYNDIEKIKNNTDDNIEKYEDIYKIIDNNSKIVLFDYVFKNDLFNNSQKMQKLFRIIPNYFKYRYENKKLDHGIFAGIKLFESLEKNRKFRKDQQELNIENNSPNSLYWGDDLTALYAQASLAISMHNIWISDNNEESIKKYKEFGLSAIIADSKEIFPISIDENPLLFLFGLVDTIEPIKTFNCVPTTYVLKNILIDFLDNTIVIKNSKNSKLEFSNLKNKIKGLDKWLYVTINCNLNEIRIKINKKDNKNVL